MTPSEAPQDSYTNMIRDDLRGRPDGSEQMARDYTVGYSAASFPLRLSQARGIAPRGPGPTHSSSLRARAPAALFQVQALANCITISHCLLCRGAALLRCNTTASLNGNRMTPPQSGIGWLPLSWRTIIFEMECVCLNSGVPDSDLSLRALAHGKHA